jgi:hypothetical protein
MPCLLPFAVWSRPFGSIPGAYFGFVLLLAELSVVVPPEPLLIFPDVLLLLLADDPLALLPDDILPDELLSADPPLAGALLFPFAAPAADVSFVAGAAVAGAIVVVDVAVESAVLLVLLLLPQDDNNRPAESVIRLPSCCIFMF